MRAVFSTMPSFAPAIFSVKKRSHSPSLNSIAFSASSCVRAGVNAKAITLYLGHSSIEVTFDRYGHLMPGNEAEAVERIDAYLERANSAARLAALDDYLCR